MIFQSISLVLFLAYSVLIIFITIGWWRLKVFKNTEPSPVVKVSVVIAVRNEAINIKPLLNSLLMQDYPTHLYEIIFVDDHSTDNTVLEAKEFIMQHKDVKKLKLIILGSENGFGKKVALRQGISASTGELILITDADCNAGRLWLSTIAGFYTRYRPHMILGPVRMTVGGNLFGKLQSLEFLSLLSSAAGSCNAGFPLLANGANIAFTSQAYESCGGFAGNMLFPSGDDMFLMMSIKKKFGAKSIRFIRAVEAIVDTPSTNGLSPFIQQRLRWVSKSRGYTDTLLIASSIIVFLANAWLVAIAVSAVLFPGFFKLFLIVFLFKMLVDLPLMFSYGRFQRSLSLIWLFPVMELLNAVYTSFIGIAGNTVKYEWKGRKS